MIIYYMYILEWCDRPVECFLFVRILDNLLLTSLNDKSKSMQLKVYSKNIQAVIKNVVGKIP